MTMRGLLRLILILTLAVLPAAMVAQTEPVLTNYFRVPSFFNPAAAGDTDFIRLRAGSRMQWLGIDGAPRDIIVAADTPFRLFGQRFGTGAVMLQETIGLYSTLNVSAQLAYRRKIGKKGLTLSGAVQVGYLTQSFKGSEVFIPDDDDFHESTDEAIPTSDVTGSSVDLAAGLWVTHPKFYAGLSCSHLTAPVIKMKREGSENTEEQNYEFQFSRTLYFMAGSNIPIKNTLFEVIPSLMLRSDFNRVQADVTARLRWKKFLGVGVGYRTEDAVSVLLEAEFKGITIAYSYDYATSAIMRASSGSHEVWLGYSLKLDFSEKNRNRHKSIRIM